jgi:hypothetical protein
MLMAHTVVVRGRIVGSTTIQVDEPIPAETTGVEVVLYLSASSGAESTTVGEYVRRLPPGHRTQEDIDRQIRQERDSWRD